MPVISPLAAGGGNDLQLELNQMRALLKGVDWPPYYNEMCGTEVCAKANSGQARLKVGVDFTIEKLGDGLAKASDYRIWRDSSYTDAYDLSPSTLIKAVCP